MKTYIPNPLDTEHIVLPEALNELTEQMARNVHRGSRSRRRGDRRSSSRPA